MRLVLWASGPRGIACLNALLAAGRRPSLVVAHPPGPNGAAADCVEAARQAGLPCVAPLDPHDPASVARLQSERADVFVLAGYGRILRQPLLELPGRLIINLHAGELPRYRGSSPLNWALINGERSVTLSIIRVDAGVDTGDVLLERRFEVGPNDTIADLHRIANREFPGLLLDVLRAIESEQLRPRRQDPAAARYFPLRFPDDGLILWDTLTAHQIHNRIRALCPPYPGAFSFLNGRRLTLLESRLRDEFVAGEPGRIYRVTPNGVLACAADRCLWIRAARFDDDGSSVIGGAGRYDAFATLRQAALHFYETGALACGSDPMTSRGAS